MERRKLGGVSISRLGLGTMTWGRDTDENEAAQQLQEFVEAGGNLVDTAAVYGDDEKIVKKTSAKRSEKDPSKDVNE